MSDIHATKRIKDGVMYYTFPILDREGIKHGFSTKVGGVSEGIYASMNLGFKTGDSKELVLENHKRFASAVGYDLEKLVLTDQIHETTIRRVDSSDTGKGIVRDSDIIGVDGLITNDPEVVLMTFFADCVPLFLYDRRNKAIGASHSGWRGTVKHIGARTIETMSAEFGTKPEDIIAVIGPSISQDYYEVSEDVIEEFRACFDERYWSDIFCQKPEQFMDKKYQLNLWRANEIIFEEAGVPAKQIEVSDVCTYKNSDVLFSHRATGGKRGSLAGVITLERA